MIEEENRDNRAQDQGALTEEKSAKTGMDPADEGGGSRQPDAEAVLPPKKRTIIRKKKQLEPPVVPDADTTLSQMDTGPVEAEKKPTVKRVRRTSPKKPAAEAMATLSESSAQVGSLIQEASESETPVQAESLTQKTSMPDTLNALSEVEQGGHRPTVPASTSPTDEKNSPESALQKTSTGNVKQGDAGVTQSQSSEETPENTLKTPRRRAPRKRSVSEESGQAAVTTADKQAKVKEKSQVGGKTKSDKKPVSLSYKEGVEQFVRCYHQTVSCLDDLAFRDALAKLHTQQTHWKPQLEEAITVFLDEAMYVESSMSLHKLQRTLLTAYDLWGACHAAMVHTQGQFMRASHVVSSMMQSLGDIMLLDFSVPEPLTKIFLASKSTQAEHPVSQEVPETGTEDSKMSDDAAVACPQETESGADNLLAALQPFAISSSSNVLEDTQKRFADMATKARQYSQSGVSHAASYGYLVGAFYAELTAVQIALMICGEHAEKHKDEKNYAPALAQTWSMLSCFKSELIPLIRATGVFSVEGDRRRSRGHGNGIPNESLTALLAAMGRSITAVAPEPNHNNQKQSAPNTFYPSDLD